MRKINVKTAGRILDVISWAKEQNRKIVCIRITREQNKKLVEDMIISTGSLPTDKDIKKTMKTIYGIPVKLASKISIEIEI
jgi:hypothetical protein